MRIDVVGKFSRRLALAIAKRASDSKSVVPYIVRPQHGRSACVMLLQLARRIAAWPLQARTIIRPCDRNQEQS
jgi:hypothetical protein